VQEQIGRIDHEHFAMHRGQCDSDAYLFGTQAQQRARSSAPKELRNTIHLGGFSWAT